MLIRNGVLAFLLLCASGCNVSDSPTSPLPPPSATQFDGAIYGSVRSAATGECLAGATAELMDGPRPGERVVQTESACSAFSFDKSFVFKLGNLPRGEMVTLRASMEGFEPRVVQVTVTGSDRVWTHTTETLVLDLMPQR